MMTFCVSRIAFVLILIVTATFANESCPLQCRCSKYVVECIGKDLKTIPNGFPLTAAKIDLSNNPSLQIRSDYFLQFKHLYILVLNNCGQRGPIYLPSHLRQLYIDSNHFTANALRQMIQNNTKFLTRFTLENNRLQPSDVTHLLMFLPTGIEELHLSNNNITILKKKGIKRFPYIRTLGLSDCSLKVIEQNAFDNMKLVSKIFFINNNLKHLPNNLFRFNKNLNILHFTNNMLTTFNARKLGLINLQHIFLVNNSLTSFSLQATKISHLWLSDNNIQRISKDMLPDTSTLVVLDLKNNKLHSISENTFSTITKISNLCLHENNLKSLPRNVFKGMIIANIFLQKNHLTNINGVFHGMKRLINVLVLTGNKELQYLNATELAGFSNKSTIYITCNYLRQIIDLSLLSAKVKCSPKADLIVKSLYRDPFVCNGYQCQYHLSDFQFSCRACRPGYYSDCIGKHKIEGKCVKCPPGSYYQDQPASTKCKTCRPGQYVPPEHSPGTDASGCLTCPIGTNTTIIAGTRACKCLHGYSRRYRFGPCEKCREDGLDCSHDYLTLKQGFWMTWQGTKANYHIQPIDFRNNTNTKHSNNTTCEHDYRLFIQNLNIRNDSYDRRTMQFDCHMPVTIKCPMSGSCLGGLQPTCSKGYTGVLCAVCKRGYTRHFNHCVQCPQSVWAVFQFFGYTLIFVILCFIISFTDKINIEYSHSHLQPHQKVNCRTFADVILSSVKILIGFYQILISIIHAFANVHWPSNLKKATHIFQYMQLEIIRLPSLRCIKPDWNIDAVTEFWIVVITIIAVPFLALIYYLTKSLYIHITSLSPSDDKTRRYLCGRNCAKAVALFLFLTYPLISTKIVQILPIGCHSFCVAKQHGVCIHSLSYLRSDYSIPCLTMSDNKFTLIIAYTFLAIPFGLPILLFILLRTYALEKPSISQQSIKGICDVNDEERDEYANHFHLSNVNNQFDPMMGASNVPIMTFALKFSYENYHSNCWYWEVVEMKRKIIMTVGVVVFLIHTKIGLSCAIMVAMVFTILHAVIKPLKSNFESAVQLLSLTFVPLNLSIGAVLQSQETENANIIGKETDSFSLSILLVSMNSSLVILVVGRFLVIIIGKILSRMKKKYL